MGRSSKQKIMVALTALMLCLALACMLGSTALASSTIDWNEKGSITVLPKDGDDDVSGGTFALYKVADAGSTNNNLTFELIEPFDTSGVDINAARTAMDLQDMAVILSRNEFLSLVNASDVISVNGGDTVDNLDLGVYLVVQTGSISGYIDALPFLVFIPTVDGGVWDYDTPAHPKLLPASPPPPPPGESPTPTPTETPTPTPTETPTETPTPTPTETDIMDEGTPLSDITFDPDEMIWIDEDIPLGELPQTGQLKWPMPIMAGAGIVLIIVGINLTRGKRKTDA